MQGLLPRSHSSASAKTSWRPAGTVSVTVPLPDAPSAAAAVNVTSTDAAVVPRFPSVISEMKCAPFAPTTSTTTGTVRTATWPVRVGSR